MISIILPAYNEEVLIKHSTETLIKAMNKITRNFEIIIVEESSDRTPEISTALEKKYNVVRHFHSDKRLGKGKAVEYGAEKARGKKIIFMDADLAVDLSALESMIGALDEYDVVVGSRYHPGSKSSRTLLRLFLGRAYAILSCLALRINIRDFQCGFKGFKKYVWRDIMGCTEISGVFWDTEFLHCTRKKGYKIHEIPIVWKETKGRSTKIGIKTIFYMGMNLVKLFLKSWLN